MTAPSRPVRNRLTALTLVMAAIQAPASGQGDENRLDPSGAEHLHRSAFVVDLHADTLYRLAHGDRLRDDASLQATPARLKAGGVDAQFFALWVSPREPDIAQAMARQLTAFWDVVLDDGARVALARDGDDVRRIVRSGRIAALLGLEGALALAGDPSMLRTFADHGVAYVSLTWNDTNDFGQGTNGDGHVGATSKGLELVRLANELHVILDVSHASPSTFWDVVTASRRPVIASHSNAAAVFAHPRNLDDAQLWGIAESGGVVGLNLYSAFVSGRKPAASMADLMAHLRHLRELVGNDHIAIGSDFDGSPDPVVGLEDASRMGALTSAMLAEGLVPEEIVAILGGNVLRVLDQTRHGLPVRAVTHRPAEVLGLTTNSGGNTAKMAVDRNTRTYWRPVDAVAGVAPAIRVTVAGPGVDRVGVVPVQQGVGGRAQRVVVEGWCNGRRVAGPVSLEVGPELRPKRAELFGLATCARPTVEVRVVNPGGQWPAVGLSEVLCEVGQAVVLDGAPGR